MKIKNLGLAAGYVGPIHNPLTDLLFFAFCICWSQAVLPDQGQAFPVTFTGVTQEARIQFKHHSGKNEHHHIVETMAAGAAFLDYDNDGFLDLCLIESGSLEAEPTYVNRLYRNNSDGTFIDVTEQAQVGNSERLEYKLCFSRLRLG